VPARGAGRGTLGSEGGAPRARGRAADARRPRRDDGALRPADRARRRGVRPRALRAPDRGAPRALRAPAVRVALDAGPRAPHGHVRAALPRVVALRAPARGARGGAPSEARRAPPSGRRRARPRVRRGRRREDPPRDAPSRADPRPLLIVSKLARESSAWVGPGR